jgi:hypothetical protein
VVGLSHGRTAVTGCSAGPPTRGQTLVQPVTTPHRRFGRGTSHSGSTSTLRLDTRRRCPTPRALRPRARRALSLSPAPDADHCDGLRPLNPTAAYPQGLHISERAARRARSRHAHSATEGSGGIQPPRRRTSRTQRTPTPRSSRSRRQRCSAPAPLARKQPELIAESAGPTPNRRHSPRLCSPLLGAECSSCSISGVPRRGGRPPIECGRREARLRGFRVGDWLVALLPTPDRGIGRPCSRRWCVW